MSFKRDIFQIKKTGVPRLGCQHDEEYDEKRDAFRRSYWKILNELITDVARLSIQRVLHESVFVYAINEKKPQRNVQRTHKVR